MFQKTITGPGLKVYINGIPFGIAKSISWATNAGRKPIYGIDSVQPIELIPGQQLVSGSISLLRLHNDGGLEGRNIAAPDRYIALEKYIDILVIDRLTGQPVLKVDQAAVNAQNWSVNEKGLLEGNFDWEGLDWENESMFSR